VEQSVDGGWRIAGAGATSESGIQQSVLDSGDTGERLRQACTAPAGNVKPVQFIVKQY